MTHLDLEQCKKLKDIGFPQDTYFRYGNYEPQVSAPYGQEAVLIQGELACPTLEELIEWLTGYINLICPVQKGDDEGRVITSWCAESNTAQNHVGFGSTPLEAVYNLAIAVKGAK